MPATMTKDGDTLVLDLSTCRGSEFGDALDKIREVPGRRYEPNGKLWIIAATPQAADRILKTIQPEASSELVAWVRESMIHAEESLTTPLPEDADLLLPWACKRMSWQPETINGDPVTGLTNYQRSAVDLMANTGRALVADDMGLGKTLEGIAAIEEWRLRNGQANGPKLIVAPASVKGGWERELNRWLDKPDVVVVKGSYSPLKPKPGDWLKLGVPEDEQTEKLSADQVRRLVILDGIEREAWIIVNWEQLRLDKVDKKIRHRNGSVSTKKVRVMREPLFETTEWLAVIADEAHRAKNGNAKQTQGLWRTRGQVMFALTGTPIMNHPGDLWAVLAWLWPDEFHKDGKTHGPNATAYVDFYDTYVEHYEDFRRRKIVTGVKNPEALRFVLKHKLIRRTSSLLGLKGRKRIFYPVPLNPGQQKLYEDAETAMWLSVQEDASAGNAEALKIARAAAAGETDLGSLIRISNGAARLTRLRQIVENAALLGGADDSAIMDDFEQKYLDSESQWVFFCQFKESCELLAERLRKYPSFATDESKAQVGVFNGDYRPHVRSELEDEFQSGKLDVMVGTLDAMYQGVNLQRAHLMGFVSRSFVPVIDDQAEAREDRKGQHELVRVYIPEPPGTVSTGTVKTIAKLKQSIERAIITKDIIEEVYE